MRRKTRDVAANLAALRAPTACRILPGGGLSEVPADTIEPGDLILIRPGDRVAVDGEVVSGASEIDRSLVTGETALAAVKPGDAVHAGSINHGGALQVRALKAAGGTLLDEIERLMSKAGESRSGYVKLADKAARLYAPVVHSAALLTFFGWMLLGLSWQQALVISITVLIITCPCALGLAIPAVQVAAAGALFRRSVLLNSGEALERLAAVDTVVFDKTGTLTEPEARILNSAEISAEDLRLAGRLAHSSRHPLARAVVRASGEEAPFADARETPGEGVEAIAEGVPLRLGSPAFCGAADEAAAVAAATRTPPSSPSA